MMTGARTSPVLLTVAAMIGGVGAAIAANPSSPAAAAVQTIAGARLTWAVNDTASAGAYFGGCNFLSAGTAGDNGSAKAWTQTSPSPGYATQIGSVTIQKPNTSNEYSQPTWATKCTGRDNATPLTLTTSSETRVEFSGGTGTVDPATGTVRLHWTGSFTSAFYGGMVYWSVTDPTLTVDADGTGALTAQLSGYGADMADLSQWRTLAPVTATLATFSHVAVTATGFSVAGESSFWYSSGLHDADKVPAPLTVTYPAIPGSTAPASHSTSASPSPTPSSPALYHPTVSLDQPTPAAGGTISFSASGFATGETIDVAVQPDAVTLTRVVADGSGNLTGSATLPASVQAGAHTLVLTGQTSVATAQQSFMVTAQASCELADGVKGGWLVWGFKASFRSYVAAGFPANSITATGGAQILDRDLAITGVSGSGTFLWPFVSSSAYTSPSDFTAQYGGTVRFSYPGHFFEVSIANPKVVVKQSTGTLYADVSLTVSEPGTDPSTSTRTAEELATIDLGGTSPVSNDKGITRVLHTAIAGVDSFSFNGTAFYAKGQALDDATVLLSGCTGGTAPDPNASDNPPADNTGLDNDSDLIPITRFRPDGSLARTGQNLPVLLGLAALLLAGGAALVMVARTRRRRPSATPAD